MDNKKLSFQNTIDIKLFGETFTLNFPNIAQWFEIRAVKSRISYGEFANYQMYFEDDAQYITAVNAIATFSVLCGDKLRGRLNTESLLNLPLESMMEMIYAYVEQFLPWYEPIMSAINKKDKGTAEAVTTTETTTVPVV